MKHKRGRIVALGAVSALGALNGIWLCTHSWDSSPVSAPYKASEQNGTIRTPAGMPSPFGVSERIRFQPESGKRYTYSFARRIHVEGLGQQIPEIQYAGKFFVDVVHADSAGFDAWVSEQIASQSLGPSPELKVHVAASGKSIALSAPVLQNEEERQQGSVLKDLLATWVFPLESDTVGAYQARYEPAVFRGAVASVRKHKVAYLKTRGAGSVAIPEIVRSEHIARWDMNRLMPVSIQGAELTRLGASASKDMSFASDASYEMDFVGVSAIPSAKPDGALHAESLVLTPDSTSGRARARWSAADWPKLLDRIVHVRDLSSSEQLALFGDVAAYLRANPNGANQLLGLLSSAVIAAGPSSPLFKLAVGALATAGTPEAQSALVHVYQDSNCATEAKGTILAAFTTTQASLTPQTRDFLLTESQTEPDADLANGAEWALGSSLQNAAPDASAERSIASIEQSWQSATAPQELVLLDAMGNSGRSEFLPILTSVIEGEGDQAVRSKAVFALRFIQTPDAISLLGQSISDPQAAVRLAAASAMQAAPWNPAFQAPLSKCASSETVGQVQSACQQALKNAGT